MDPDTWPTVLPPPADLKDGSPARDALDPLLDGLLAAAEIAGWRPVDVLNAVLAWAVQRAFYGLDEPLTLHVDAVEVVRANVSGHRSHGDCK